MVAAALVGSAAIGAVGSNMAANTAAGAAGSAANQQQIAAWTAQVQQEQAAQRAQDQLQQQQDRVRALLDPYMQAGNSAVGGQKDLLGLNGGPAQQAAYDAISNSPGFNSVVQQGENAIRQNASATGGLRGGNTQAALAQYRPSMLQAAIDQQYQRLSGLTNIGQNAAAGVGNSGNASTAASVLAGTGAANAISALTVGGGQAQAGAALAQGRAAQQGINGITSAFGTGLSGLSGLNQYSASPYNTSGNTGVTGTDDLSTFLNNNNNYGTSGGVAF